jgi:chromosome transmission fidelity protein 18
MSIPSLNIGNIDIFGRPIDTLTDYLTACTSGTPAIAPVRYAVRQVLDQEYQKSIIVRENAARQARYKAGNPNEYDSTGHCFGGKEKESMQENLPSFVALSATKKDFFGRIKVQPLEESDRSAERGRRTENGRANAKDDNKVWVSFHEGFSNAVRKPITVEELMRGLL